MIEWIKPLLGEMLGKMSGTLSSVFVKNGKEWWRKSLNWIHCKTAPPSTSLPAPMDEQGVAEEETDPPSANKLWRVRGYNGGVIVREDWLRDRAAAVKMAQDDIWTNDDASPYCRGVVVKNYATGKLAYAVGEHPKQHNRKMDVSHLPATDPDDLNDLPEEDIPF